MKTSTWMTTALCAAALAAPRLAHADPQGDAVAAATNCVGQTGRLKLPSLEDAGQYSKGAGDSGAEDARHTIALIDKVLAGGAKGTDTFEAYGDKVTWDAARTQCQAVVDYYVALEKLIDQAHAEEDAKIAVKYKAVGVAGAKLDLFVYYDNVSWRGAPRCDIVDDVKQLAKAKVLFQWLDNADGTITIRKYQFSGNKVVAKTDRTFDKEANAWKACK